jgi:hypothetical protein
VIVAAARGIVRPGMLIEDGIEIALEHFEEDVGRKSLRPVVIMQVSAQAGDAVARGDHAAEIVRNHDEREIELVF